MEKVTSREQVRRGVQYYLAVKEGEKIRSYAGRTLETRQPELIEIWIKAGLLWFEPQEEVFEIERPGTFYKNR